MIDDSDPFVTDTDLTEETQPSDPHAASAGYEQIDPPGSGTPEVADAEGGDLPDPEDPESGFDPEEPPAAAPVATERKKGLPLWVWIALGAAGIVAVAGGLAVLTMPKGPARESVRAPVAMRPAPARQSSLPASTPPGQGETVPSTMEPPGTDFPPAAPAALPGTPAPPAPAPSPTALSVAAPAATAPASEPGTARTLARILSRVEAMQSSLARLRRMNAPGPTPASEIARLRAEHEHDARIIRGLEAERAALRRQVRHLLRGPLYGWKVAGLSSTAVVLRNAHGALRVVRPGDRVAGTTVVSIDVAGRRFITSHGPVNLPAN